MHNKEYALKLVQDKINGLNNYIYTDYLINYYSYILLTPIILYIFTKIWQNNKCLLQYMYQWGGFNYE